MNRIESLLSVQDILYEALNRMDIHEQDIQIIFENINSFEELLQIGSEKIDNLPNYLSAIQPFFSSST